MSSCPTSATVTRSCSPELGHTTSFWSYQPKASTQAAEHLPRHRQGRPIALHPGKGRLHPEISHTALGKGLAATIIALPALVLLSLLLMWRRSRKRGRIGRKASIALRSVFTLVLGLGGWFVGLLLVLMAFPTMALDNMALSVVAIGLPIGMGIYLAWLDRSRPGRTIGLSAAMAGSLVGAWLGFQAANGLAAVITTIIGAAIGANLPLIVLDTHDSSTAEVVKVPQQVPTTALQA